MPFHDPDLKILLATKAIAKKETNWKIAIMA
jgi:hypothetical protein